MLPKDKSRITHCNASIYEGIYFLLGYYFSELRILCTVKTVTKERKIMFLNRCYAVWNTINLNKAAMVIDNAPEEPLPQNLR